jgi:outer membrane protein, multidrug efflux system
VRALVPSALAVALLALPARAEDGAWWRSFGDSRLDGLVERALERNGDAAAAQARVEQAEAVARQALAPLLPSVFGVMSANMGPQSTLLGPRIPGLPVSDEVRRTGSALAQAALEPDLFGRRYLAWRASRFDALASEGDRDALWLAISTRVAETYFDWVWSTARKALVEEQLEVNGRLLELVELRFDTGGASALDVLQQRQQTAASFAQLPQIRARLRTAEQQLAILSGGEAKDALGPARAELPLPPELPPEGISLELLERRPDLRASLARLSGHQARSRSAVRALLPQLRLTGQAGYQALWDEGVTTEPTWGASAALSVPLYLGGAEYAAIAQADAAARAQAATFTQLAKVAAAEVEGALVREREGKEQIASLERQVEAASLTLEESRARYLEGLTNYLPVLTALSAHQQSQLALLQARRELLSNHIQLNAALGGALALSPAGAPDEVIR